jgi:hypothetical protein
MFTAITLHESSGLYVSSQAKASTLEAAVSLVTKSFIQELEFLSDTEARLASDNFTITVSRKSAVLRPKAP